MIDSDRRPTMADLLLSNRRPFQCEDLYVLLPCHLVDVGQVCASVLHIISNEWKMPEFLDIHSVRLTHVSSTINLISDPLI